jgi:SAM-dependent methyltransferase
MQPDPSPLPVDDASVQAYYARGEEADRLTSGLGRVEYLRTIEVLERILPDPPAIVADVGGGPGRYTDHLLLLGHNVVHRDLVASHVDAVRTRHPLGTPTGDRLDTAAGDARRLDLQDSAVDVILLLGPLYHLPDADDRRAAMAEAARVVRPGGLVVGAAISRHAVLLDGILLKRIDLAYPQILDLLDGVRETGVIPPLFEGSFNGYAHRADEFHNEFTEAGLTVDQIISVEGLALALGDIDARLDDPAERDRLMQVLRSVESAPDLIGVGPHILALGRAPG